MDCGDVSGLNNTATRAAGRNLLEQAEPFAADRELVSREAGEVAARFRQVISEALRNRVRDQHTNTTGTVLLVC